MNWLKYCVIVCLTAICATDKFELYCGLEDISSQPLVRGGMRVMSREFPWHVAIFRNDGPGDDNYKQICGGSLVRSQLVITAAHCFSMNEDNHTVDLSAYRVVGGSLNRSWTTEDLEGRQQSEVRAVKLGENYGAHVRHFQDDIAIVHLGTEFIFSPVVRAVCLDLVDRELHNSETSPGRVGKVAGWGLTESGTLPTQLNFLQVPVVGKRQCYRQMQSNFKAFITSDKICAGLTNGSAMCPGDSGGGLVFPLQDSITGLPRWYLRAILSNGPRSNDPLNEQCQTKYLTVYSNVLSHGTWLSTNMEHLQPQKTCRVKGSVGSCEEYSNCPAAKKEACNGILPQKCSPSSTKICCVESRETMETVENCAPLPRQRKTGSKAKDYCIELAEKIHPCQETGSGWTRGNICPLLTPDSNIVYHKTPVTNTAEAPHYGQIGTGQRGGITWRGEPVSLVSDQWVLCSAYIITVIGSSVKFVGLGGSFTPQYNPDEIYGVTNRLIHPLYDHDYSYAYNDIALLQLDRRVTFTAKILPACLHTGTPLPDSGFIQIDGFGHKTTMQGLSQEECSRAFPTGSSGHPDGVKHDLQICSRPVNTTGECSGWYIGSPLTLHNSHRVACTHLLVGLASYYIYPPCTVTNSRISSFIPWIEGIVWP